MLDDNEMNGRRQKSPEAGEPIHADIILLRRSV